MSRPMRRRPPRLQSGFTIVELVITMCIIAVLSSIALTSMRDYSRRAQITEVVMAGGACKNTVQEGYPVRDNAPDPGGWGCEVTTSVTKYAGAVQTSSNGVIRITIRNMDSLLNGRHIFLVPARSDGITPLATTTDLGNPVRSWICGSDWLPARNALPANCRLDLTTYASDEYN